MGAGSSLAEAACVAVARRGPAGDSTGGGLEPSARGGVEGPNLAPTISTRIRTPRVHLIHGGTVKSLSLAKRRVG